jgi:Fic family protein
MIRDLRLERLGPLLPLIEAVSRFCGQWYGNILLEPAAIKSLKRMVIASSSAASTRIEGADLDNEQALQVILKRERPPENRSAGEVLGYSEALRTALDRKYEKGDVLSQPLIKRLHRVMMKYTEETLSGRYRLNEVNVTDGRGGLLLVCALPDLVPGFMEKAVNRFNRDWRNNTRSKLVIIAEFIAQFLAIHPFEDGNGRCARLLTVMLLKMADHAYLEYTSLEEQIEKRKAQYYLTLNKTQKTGVLDGWFGFCLLTLRDAQIGLEARLKAKAPGLKDGSTFLMHEITDIFKTRATCTAGDLVTLTGKSPAGVRKVLSRMVRKKMIKAFGKNRGRYYRYS